MVDEAGLQGEVRGRRDASGSSLLLSLRQQPFSWTLEERLWASRKGDVSYVQVPTYLGKYLEQSPPPADCLGAPECFGEGLLQWLVETGHNGGWSCRGRHQIAQEPCLPPSLLFTTSPSSLWKSTQKRGGFCIRKQQYLPALSAGAGSLVSPTVCRLQHHGRCHLNGPRVRKDIPRTLSMPDSNPISSSHSLICPYRISWGMSSSTPPGP